MYTVIDSRLVGRIGNPERYRGYGYRELHRQVLCLRLEQQADLHQIIFCDVVYNFQKQLVKALSI